MSGSTIDWVEIPEGILQRGTPLDELEGIAARYADTGVPLAWYRKEAPRTPVRVPAFRISRVPVTVSRRLLPPMLQRGWGRIVFIGTESAVDVPGDMIPYGTMKAASLALAAGLAKLTRGTEVTVNTVLGGPAYSDGVAATVEQIAAAQSMTVEQLKAGLVRDSSLLQRFIHPREIADLVVYLSSPLASATNGAALRADGGVLTTAY